MNDNALINISSRMKNDFYVGVVGSVRSGKSTFIKRFIEKKVIPYIDDEFLKNKILDELPQTAEGKQIMTEEPKFVPQSALPLVINQETTINVRLVDSVGYIIDGAIGYQNDEGPRLVKTPWQEEAIPFKEAAEIGCKKVIENHSTIGILLTSDGSFGEFSRREYEKNEEMIVEELKNIDKPFVIILNTKDPNSKLAIDTKNKIEEKYDISCVCVNALEMDEIDIDNILTKALDEFSISELDMKIPSWINELNDENNLKVEINELISNSTMRFKKFKHVDLIKNEIINNRNIKDVQIESINPSTGSVSLVINVLDELYNNVLDELFGNKISTRSEFIKMLVELKEGKIEYDSIKKALQCAKTNGYGISFPNLCDMTLEKPEIIKQGSRYGIKLKAIAPSIHMIKVDVESTFEPIIGSEEQSKSLIEGMTNDIWNQEIFGRTISEVVNDGIKAKINMIPDQAKYKFRETLEKIVNNANGGLIAIIL